MGEDEELSPEIHNITVEKLDSDRFRVLLGTQTEIPDLYSASTGIELDRALLEQFIESAQKALAE
ncbi:hypothetical protein OAA99_01000 [Omnitrophica bacterium]|nr:hypothetical protein [Candidatus Omnitrophota bacterium]